MILLDTNILLRFILGDEPNLSSKAREIFEKIDKQKIKVYITLLTISEVIFTLEKSYKLPKSEIISKILSIIKQANLNVEKQGLLQEVFSYYLGKNLSFVDAYHVAFMHKKKIKEIFSFDHDFDKFPQIKRLES